jgi:hypothetical protein
MRKLILILVVALASSAVTAAAITLPARGDGTPDTPDTPKAAPEEDRADRGLLEGLLGDVESCLSENGLDLEDPELRLTPDGLSLNGRKLDRDLFEELRRECAPLVPESLFEPPADLKERLDRCLEVLRPEEDDVS